MAGRHGSPGARHEEPDVHTSGGMERLTLLLRAVARGPDDDAYELILRQATAELGATGGLLGLVDRHHISIASFVGYEPELVAQFDPIPLDAAFPLAEAYRTQQPVWVPDAGQRATRYPTLAARSTGAEATASVPLVLGDEVIGVLGVSYTGPHDFTPEDRSFLNALADYCAVLVDLRRSSRWASWGESLLRSGLTGVLVGEETTVEYANDTFLDMVGRTRRDLEEGRIDWMAMTPPEHRQQDREGMARLRAGEAFPMVDKEYLRPDGTRMPVRIGGVMLQREPYRWLSIVVDRRAHDSELASRSAALHHAEQARIDAERRLALEVAEVEALQRSVLPSSLPRSPGLSLAACYEPAATATHVGGDWYDAFPLRDGRVALTMGDVAGKGLDAATVMGRLSNAARVAVLSRSEPDEALLALDEALHVLDEDTFATAVIAVLDPRDGTLAWVRAGHPPPAIRRADGTVELRWDGARPLVGVAPEAPTTPAEAILEPGDALVLFTDGLVERRDEPVDVGLGRLTTALAGDPADDPEGFLVRVVRACRCDRHDDACILLARRR